MLVEFLFLQAFFLFKELIITLYFQYKYYIKKVIFIHFLPTYKLLFKIDKVYTKLKRRIL